MPRTRVAPATRGTGPREAGAAAPPRAAPHSARRPRPAHAPRSRPADGVIRAAAAPSPIIPFAILRRALGTQGTGDGHRTMGPTRRQPIGTPVWNDQAAVAILVVCARHLLAVESPPLTPDRLVLFVAGLDLPALVPLCAQSPDGRLRRLTLVGQVVYYGVMHGLPIALGDPFFRLDLAKAAATVGLDLFPSTRSGR